MKFDVAICTKDRPADLATCLESVDAQTLRPHRTIVVNAGGPVTLDPTVEVVKSAPGLPLQRNLALKLLDSELIAFLDDDVVLSPDYFALLVPWFVDHPRAVGVGGHIENDVPFSPASLAFRRLFALSIGDGMLQPSGDAMYRYHPEEPSRVDVLSGSNMVWRRDAVDGLEFDEALSGYAYMEDADFALRAGRRGDLWTLPNARLRHSKTTTSRVAYREYVRQVIVNGAYLYAKHRIARNLRPTAYARRLIGRCIAFAALATARRTIQPIGGILDGLAEVPRALRCGAEASRQ